MGSGTFAAQSTSALAIRENDWAGIGMDSGLRQNGYGNIRVDSGLLQVGI
jgi:hypothetical protein